MANDIKMGNTGYVYLLVFFSLLFILIAKHLTALQWQIKSRGERREESKLLTRKGKQHFTFYWKIKQYNKASSFNILRALIKKGEKVMANNEKERKSLLDLYYSHKYVLYIQNTAVG